MTDPDVTYVCLAWSDDLILNAQRLTRWITDYVDLEESLAVGSIVQEDLAHARALLEFAGCSIEERDWRIFDRAGEEWCPAEVVICSADEWDGVVAQEFFFSRAAIEVARVLLNCVDEQARATASVILAEQELHATHWARWVAILSRDTVTSDRMRESLGVAAGQCADLFGLPAELAAGFDQGGSHKRWIEAVTADLTGLGIEVPELPGEATPRVPGGVGSSLAEILGAMRAVRERNPDRVYGIYR